MNTYTSQFTVISMLFLRQTLPIRSGLTRHISTKHHLIILEPNKKVKKILRPTIYYENFKDSIKELAQDECYLDEICK